MKILYVDHIFHTKTKSSDFFLEALKRAGEVDVVYVDPDTNPKVDIPVFLKSTRFEAYDLIVVWQLEVFALAALARGVPVAIVPMFDGCSAQPDFHWRILGQAAVINFSLNLHLRTRQIAPLQMLMQYYPNPDDFPEADFSGANRVLFWLRRPGEVSVEGAMCLCRGGFEQFHVHLAPDNKLDSTEIPEWLDPYGVTTSTWFKTREEFDDLISQYNVVVCPRLTEGIGMFMTEALARGMCVIAPGRPTHNEYIANGVNGFLFEPGNYSAINLDRAAEMGRRAREGAYRGHKRWLRQVEALPTFMLAVAERAPRPAFSPQTADEMIFQYFTDMGLYHQTAAHVVNHLPPIRAKIVVPPALPAVPPRSLVANGALSNYSPPPCPELAGASGPTLETTIELMTIRARMARVPGWNQMKKMVPQNVKAGIAKLLISRRRRRALGEEA